ncbi:predicted GPI-anchored protein 58 [Bufo bufo]|uniref:predicted GPI-anchored protein 58 n=1 Tax=Bufo bufo TaxID=8384 RepID=UPI001ABE7B5F|nr:predicted GPI-anchored protein 58 [Bufo bufo]
MAFHQPWWNQMAICGEAVYEERPQEIHISQILRKSGPSVFAIVPEAVDSSLTKTDVPLTLPSIPEEGTAEVPLPTHIDLDLIKFPEAVDPSALSSSLTEYQAPPQMDTDAQPAFAEDATDVAASAVEKPVTQMAPEFHEYHQEAPARSVSIHPGEKPQPAPAPRIPDLSPPPTLRVGQINNSVLTFNPKVQPCFMPPYMLPWKQTQVTAPALPAPMQPEVLPVPAPAVDSGLQQATAAFSRLSALPIPAATGRGQWRTTTNATPSYQQRLEQPLMRFSSSSSDEELDTYL